MTEGQIGRHLCTGAAPTISIDNYATLRWLTVIEQLPAR
jgi:hypothetical protein